MKIVIHCGKRVGDEEDSRRCRGAIEISDMVPMFTMATKPAVELDAQHLIDQFYEEHRHIVAPTIELREI